MYYQTPVRPRWTRKRSVRIDSEHDKIDDLSESLTVKQRRQDKHVARSCRQTTYQYRDTNLTTVFDTDQILEYYVAQSRIQDVTYYFDEKRDWRVSYLVPMCQMTDPNSQTLKSLFGCLRRLRDDGITSQCAVYYLNDAFRQFQPTYSSADRYGTLAAILLFMQVDFAMNTGQNCQLHLRAAAIILKEILATKEPLKPIESCLVRIFEIYDLQSALFTDDTINLSLKHYESRWDGIWAIAKIERLGIEDVWTLVHKLWADLIVLLESTPEDTSIGSDTLSAKIIQGLLMLQAVYEQNAKFKPYKSPIAFHCPAGSSILFKSHAYRLMFCHKSMLILVLCSYQKSAAAYFDCSEARNAIFQAHAHIFNAAEAKWRLMVNDKLLHLAFPAIMMLLCAAAELGEGEINIQKWFVRAMDRCALQGYNLGQNLLEILQSGKQLGPNEAWPKMGAYGFVMTCRAMRRSGAY